MNKIKVLIVDDSALVRQFLSETLAADEMIEVIGTAIDPIFAFSKLMKVQPDVITLDVEMPRMDGLTFLAKLMSSYAIPVVMISSQTQKGCETTMRALELGAVDFITKPSKSLYENLDSMKEEIIRKVKNAARANLKVSKVPLNGSLTGQLKSLENTRQAPVNKSNNPGLKRCKLVVIGASTGGVIAVKKVLANLDARSVAVLVVLHMPAGFTTSFAGNLDSGLPYPVREARNGELLKPGNIYVAPGNRNTLVETRGNDLITHVVECTKEDIYRPSVDKAFYSVAQSIGNRAVAVILTGMGDDGARGMLFLRQSGAHTIAQSKETSMIFGMPKKAIETGGVEFVIPLGEIAEKLNELI